jgi:3-isopropylmalate/(R)-2-methylmalate dehydratase large subunit
MPGQTLAQKLVARAAGRASVAPGEIVTCRVDLAMVHDSSGPRRHAAMLERLGAKVWDPSRLVVVTDHFVPATDPESRAILELTRRWAAENAVRLYDGEGISHVVLPERGHLAPGMFVVGGDSHSPTGGAFGCYMFGVGATEMLGVLVTGEIWLKVPETIRMEWRGVLGRGVSAKDMMLHVCGTLGLDAGRYQAVHYAGEAVQALPMQERMTLANMTAEIGGQAGLVAPDAVTAEWLARIGVRLDAADLERWQDDSDARPDEIHRFDAGALAPQVAAPHSPANARPVAEFERTPVDTVYVGACTGAKLDDLRMSAAVLRGRRVRPGVDLVVAPASRRDREAAAADGTLRVLEEAGARFLDSACGLCAGYGPERLGEGAVAVSTTARNFRGRMGSPGARVYLASPYTAAAAAVAGAIVDPREYVA